MILVSIFPIIFNRKNIHHCISNHLYYISKPRQIGSTFQYNLFEAYFPSLLILVYTLVSLIAIHLLPHLPASFSHVQHQSLEIQLLHNAEYEKYTTEVVLLNHSSHIK